MHLRPRPAGPALVPASIPPPLPLSPTPARERARLPAEERGAGPAPPRSIFLSAEYPPLSETNEAVVYVCVFLCVSGGAVPGVRYVTMRATNRKPLFSRPDAANAATAGKCRFGRRRASRGSGAQVLGNAAPRHARNGFQWLVRT